MSYETVERSPSFETVRFIEGILSREVLAATVKKTFLILPNRGEGDEYVGIALSSWERQAPEAPAEHYRTVGVVALRPRDVLECLPGSVSDGMLDGAVLRYTVRLADPAEPYGAFAFEEASPEPDDAISRNVIVYEDIERKETGPEASAFHEKLVSLLPPVSRGKSTN